MLDLHHGLQLGAVGGIVHRAYTFGAYAVLSGKRSAHSLQMPVEDMFHRSRAFGRQRACLVQDDVQIAICQVAKDVGAPGRIELRQFGLHLSGACGCARYTMSVSSRKRQRSFS